MSKPDRKEINDLYQGMRDSLTNIKQRNAELEAALKTIADATDPDSAESYRSDDREGCLDTVHALASQALTNTDGGWRPTPPFEPTEAMIQAGLETLAENGISAIDRDPLLVWRSMFDAFRKSPPTGESG